MSRDNRKYEELKKLNDHGNDENIVIKSPFYNDVIKNPCIKEQNLSARCSLEHNADREICADHMQNYTLCLRFWDMVKIRRRINNEVPYLPAPEDRQKVKDHYKDELIALSLDLIGRARRESTKK